MALEEEYQKLEDDRMYTFNPKQNHLRLACCDCRLVHDIWIDIKEDGSIGITLEVNKEQTNLLRQESGVRGLIIKNREMFFIED